MTPSILTESVVVWALVAVACVVFGFALSRGTGKKVFAFGGAALGVLAVGLGAYLVFGLQTDRKAVRQTIDALAEAVERNDVDGVLRRVAEDAPRTRRAANFHLRLATIEWTKVRDFKINEINYHMSPPRALVSFRGSVGGKAGGLDAGNFTIVVDFSAVELRKEEDGVWRVSDRCEFSYPGGGSGPGFDR